MTRDAGTSARNRLANGVRISATLGREIRVDDLNGAKVARIGTASEQNPPQSLPGGSTFALPWALFPSLTFGTTKSVTLPRRQSVDVLIIASFRHDRDARPGLAYVH